MKAMKCSLSWKSLKLNEALTETRRATLGPSWQRASLLNVGRNKRQSSRGRWRADQSVSMTTIINKHGVCGEMCTAVATAQKEKIILVCLTLIVDQISAKYLVVYTSSSQVYTLCTLRLQATDLKKNKKKTLHLCRCGMRPLSELQQYKQNRSASMVFAPVHVCGYSAYSAVLC